MLDERAKACYRARIEQLRDEVDDAESCADLERATRAREELVRFVEELARATGFAGRDRSFADDAERARVSVHKAIKRAVAMIAEVDPSLGREIASRVVTGMRCTFRAAGGGASSDAAAYVRPFRRRPRPAAEPHTGTPLTRRRGWSMINPAVDQ